jgi:2-dehydropantoate 2-reductase
MAGSGPSVLSLQNGIDNERRIAAAVGAERTIGGLAVRIGAHVVDPGVVAATGPAQVVLGAWPTARDHPAARTSLAALVTTFCDAGIPTTLSEDIRLELWKKLMINNGVNPLSVLAELDEIAGAVIERCRRAGASAPLTELVTALLELKLARRDG